MPPVAEIDAAQAAKRLGKKAEALAHFEKYVEDYLADRKKANGDSFDHHALLNTISSIRTAEVRALWTDDPALLPQDPTEAFWWEIWLPVRGDRNAVVADFRKLATLSECQVSEHQINFPERTVDCGGGFTLTVGQNPAECAAITVPPAACTATVGDARACIGGLAGATDAEICSDTFMLPAACAALEAC